MARGKNYYEDGAVENIIQINETNWQAEHCSDLYIVDVVIDSAQNITYMDCDCPYSENCKHLAAVLYCIRDEHASVKSQKAKPKVTPSIKKLLQQQTKEQLIELILTLSSKHSAFKKELEAAYKMIVHYAESAKGRTGFIGGGQAAQATKGVDLVQERIATHIEQGHIQVAVQLALLCVYQGKEMFEYGDDSSGELGDAVEYSIDLLSQAITDGEQ